MEEEEVKENYDTPKKTRKSYFITSKIEVARYTTDHTIYSAAKKYNVDRKNVKRWKD